MSKIIYLPTPTLESWQWQDKATCKDMGTVTFSHPDDERGGTRHRRVAAAKAIYANYSVLE